MPRNGSSVYALPAGNPVIPGTVIATTWANTTLTDIATALTNSLSTDGSTASVSLAGKTMSGGTFSGPAVTGILTLTGGQIAFPAVQVPSANVNTLDDYEEGTWTPSFTFSTPGNLTIAYSTRIGVYTKIGRQVVASVNLITSTFTHTTASGVAQLTGFPFTEGGSIQHTSITDQQGMVLAGTSYISCALLNGQAIANFVFSTCVTASSRASVAVANCATGSIMNIFSTINYTSAT